MILLIAWSLVLTFSYKIVDMSSRAVIKKDERFSFLIWAIMIIVLLPFVNSTYIKLPINVEDVIFNIGFLALFFIIAAFFSGYKPFGKFNIVIFIIICPVIEEIIFRGILLPQYTNVLGGNVIIELLYVPITLPTIVSAFLFAICHLQYYKYSATTMRFMIFAFIGGILLGGVAHLTQSILFTVAIHLLFNFTAMVYANRKIRGVTTNH